MNKIFAYKSREACELRSWVTDVLVSINGNTGLNVVELRGMVMKMCDVLIKSRDWRSVVNEKERKENDVHVSRGDRGEGRQTICKVTPVPGVP
jgi:hypothetical protein